MCVSKCVFSDASAHVPGASVLPEGCRQQLLYEWTSVCVCVWKPLGKTERVCPVNTPADELLAFLFITHNLTGQSSSYRAVWSDSNIIKNSFATFSCPLSRVSFYVSTSCCCSLRFMNVQYSSDAPRWEKVLHWKTCIFCSGNE